MSNAHFVVFFHADAKNVQNVHETFINTKIPFKKRTFFIIEYRMYLKCLQKSRCFG